MTNKNEDCISVRTDDDEVELGWYVFTENYKNENIDKLKIWFFESINTDYGKTGFDINFDCYNILPGGNGKGCLYYISNPIYDSGNFEDLSVVKIKGIRLNNFVEYLKTNEIYIEDKAKEDRHFSGYCVSELKYMQFIGKKCNDTLKEILELFMNHPITRFDNFEQNIKKFDFTKFDISATNKSELNLDEHICEISSDVCGSFFNYFVLFDDLWIEKNKDLAKSLLYFSTNPHIL